ncbi:MAG: acyl-CoA dehydrogenase [Acidobacteria bacterium]|nr:MAG: acyl-CoA dehydrogenase [Acidobacteriota bacterium]
MKDELVTVLDQEARRTDAEGKWPDRCMKIVAESGLLGLTMPAEAGGAGAGMREFAEITEKIAAHCASTAMIYLMHVCGAQVIAASSSPRRADLLKQITFGRAIATLAFSERGSRSHFWAPVSRASRNNRGVILNCDKSFVTSADHADYYVVSSGSLDGKTVMDSTLYLVERNTPGIQWGGAWNGVGLRGNSSGPMLIRNCHVDESSRLTNEGEGFKIMMELVLPWFQIGSSAVSIGIAEAAFATTVAHTSSAKFEHLNETLASGVPGIRARLARMRLNLDSARAYLDHTLTRIDKASDDRMLYVLGCKATSAEMALNVTDEAMRACGGAAFSRDLSLERNFRDARAASVMAPTTDGLYDFIGKAIAGLPLF